MNTEINQTHTRCKECKGLGQFPNAEGLYDGTVLCHCEMAREIKAAMARCARKRAAIAIEEAIGKPVKFTLVDTAIIV